MDLNTVWFALIAVLFIGFFFLEGFDYGVGILHLFLSKRDDERRIIMNSIGTFWDGNEVWLVTAGGAMFAAFPHWYAAFFSGFYPALVLMLSALILRGVSFEFRSKDKSPKWRRLWDVSFFIGSALPALLWGIVLADMLRGLPIDERMNAAFGLGTLISPSALIGGLTTLVLFTYHGALFLNLKTTDELFTASKRAALFLRLPLILLLVAFSSVVWFYADVLGRAGTWTVFVSAALIAVLLSARLIGKNRTGWAFVFSGTAIVLIVTAVFAVLYPRVMISTLNPAGNLTIYNASSSPYTLRVMTIVAAVFVPVVLAYQAWTYWVFRKRIDAGVDLEY